MCVFVGVCVGVGVCVSVCYQCDQQFCSADLSHKSLGLLLPIDLATLPDTHIHKHTHTHTHHLIACQLVQTCRPYRWSEEMKRERSKVDSSAPTITSVQTPLPPPVSLPPHPTFISPFPSPSPLSCPPPPLFCPPPPLFCPPPPVSLSLPLPFLF